MKGGEIFKGIQRVTPDEIKREREVEIGEGRAEVEEAVWEERCEITGEEGK